MREKLEIFPVWGKLQIIISTLILGVLLVVKRRLIEVKSNDLFFLYCVHGPISRRFKITVIRFNLGLTWMSFGIACFAGFNHCLLSFISKILKGRRTRRLFLDTILNRHARKLLGSNRLKDLGRFSTCIEFNLREWLQKERYLAGYRLWIYDKICHGYIVSFQIIILKFVRMFSGSAHGNGC